MNIKFLPFHQSTNNKSPKYKVGDIIEVLSYPEICENLTNDDLDGCVFMENMKEHCGKIFSVFKIVNKVFDEHQLKMYKTKSVFYILDGLFCNGNVKEFNNICDRNCPIFWHESWLRKITSFCTYWLGYHLMDANEIVKNIL